MNTGLSQANFVWAWTGAHAGNWHPLTWLSHMADCSMFGLAPAGHHLVSLLLHIANVLLLFLWLSSATGARGRSALVALLFGLHPVHVESVAWVAERKDVLSTLFLMLALLAYSRYVRNPGVRVTPWWRRCSPRGFCANRCWSLCLFCFSLWIGGPCGDRSRCAIKFPSWYSRRSPARLRSGRSSAEELSPPWTSCPLACASLTLRSPMCGTWERRCGRRDWLCFILSHKTSPCGLWRGACWSWPRSHGSCSGNGPGIPGWPPDGVGTYWPCCRSSGWSRLACRPWPIDTFTCRWLGC